MIHRWSFRVGLTALLLVCIGRGVVGAVARRGCGNPSLGFQILEGPPVKSDACGFAHPRFPNFSVCMGTCTSTSSISSTDSPTAPLVVPWEGRRGTYVALPCSSADPYLVPYVNRTSVSGGNSSVLAAYSNGAALVVMEANRTNSGAWAQVGGSLVQVATNTAGSAYEVLPTVFGVGGDTVMIGSSELDKRLNRYVNGTQFSGSTRSTGGVFIHLTATPDQSGAVGTPIATLARVNAPSATYFGYGAAVRSDGGVVVGGAYSDILDFGAVYVYRDIRLGVGGASARLGSGQRLLAMEVVGQGLAAQVGDPGDMGQRYQIVAWSPYSVTAMGFGAAVVFMETATEELLLISAFTDSTCGDLKSGRSTNASCIDSGAVYALRRNTSGATGAGEYERAGMLKLPESHVSPSATFGYSMCASGTLLLVSARGEKVGTLASAGAVYAYRWYGSTSSAAVAGGSVELERSTAFALDQRLVPHRSQAGQWFGQSVASAVRPAGAYGDTVEYVAVGAGGETNASVGSASAGWKVITATGGAVSATGGVYVFGGRPLKQLAHLKGSTVAAVQRFGWRMSMNDGGVLAIGTLTRCGVFVLDLW